LQRNEERTLHLRWSGRVALRHRILAVNIFALAMLAGSLFYLDSFRSRLTQARSSRCERGDDDRPHALPPCRATGAAPCSRASGRDSRMRVRLYDGEGRKIGGQLERRGADLRPQGSGRRRLEPGPRPVLDNVFDAIVGAPPAAAGRRALPRQDRAAWPEAEAVLARGATATRLRRAPEGDAVRLGRRAGGGAERRCCS
jgi:two-component system sensor histidine kinase ChvG